VDYLLRSFTLFRIESAYEIREDLMDTIKFMGARHDDIADRVGTH
jgi:hypothetical protein